MGDPIAWWGAVSGTIAMVVGALLGLLRLTDERRRPAVRWPLGTSLSIPEDAQELAQLTVIVTMTNPSTRALSFPDVRATVQPDWPGDISFDHTAEEGLYTQNLRPPINLVGGESIGGQLLFILHGEAGLPSWQDVTSNPLAEWDHQVILEVEDSLGRTITSPPLPVYLVRGRLRRWTLG